MRDRIAVLTLDNPPVNALSASLRSGLHDGLDHAISQGALGVVIRSQGKNFSAGADITEFGKPPVDPSLGELCSHIEDCPIPVVAAIQGVALGGGFELALAAHYRVAAKDARVGLPEVKLGLLPGAGGTQRLPRLSGARAALEVIVSGEPIAAEAARQMGMLDDVVEGDLTEAARIWVNQVIQSDLGSRPTRHVTSGLSDPAAFLADIAAWRAALDEPAAGATGKIIDCVEAALLLPFEAGLRRERSAFTDLMTSDQSRGLRHAFQAERSAGKSPILATGTPTEIRCCVVIGGGQLGGSIAMAKVNCGLDVTLIEANDQALEDAVGRIFDVYDRAVAQGNLTAAERDARMTRLSGATAHASAAGADFIIHAGSEDAAQAGRDLAECAGAAGGDPILAVARDLDISVLAGATGSAERVAQMVFHPPLAANPLVEIVVTRDAAPGLGASLNELARRMGLRAVPVSPAASGNGLIAGRLRGAMRQVAEQLLGLGASPEAVDSAIRDWGFRLGPLEAEDRIGLTVTRADQSRSYPDRNPQILGMPMTGAMLAANRTGRSAGAGWFSYDRNEGRAYTDPEVGNILAMARSGQGAPITAAQITLRMQAALANAGAWLLTDKIAERPIDVDLVALSGLGMARARGGPMLAADLTGLPQLQQTLAAMNASAPGAWTPSPLWAELIKNGQQFSDLNTRRE